ncbi:Bax inhibitor-1/YccA family protein [Insolitispirillum peregrinum]|uniref:Modulator of FtsH protease n=1 Tax=Insolitispirillum peregrinum TaxID=80876 RepID=A0A1N7JJ61_9PROT|nr:Bax inhibitor-1/YccA family protein [Insolitispirillum peregrinum]SIS49294.1 hypothetical protein SAMN05421779_102320 [Insolitispirillum peregrinum]
MAFQDRDYMQARSAEAAYEVDQGLRSYMLRVYNYMASAVALTGIISWLVVNTSLSGLFFVMTPKGGYAPSMLSWGAILLSIGMVFFLSFRINHMRASTAQGLFWAYATLAGIGLAPIFYTYTADSIARVFFISAGAFAGLSLYGYTTKRDLTGFGSFLIMGLIGLLIASVVNIFMQSTMMHWVISAAGVLIFAGLTAYDTQKIKEMYYEADSAEMASKKAVMGALTLYMDFINLFLMLLRFFGDRR